MRIIGARENNLKNLSVTIPANKFVVVTGPSGSGKSSLAFGVIFAEGQRRFMESMSSYARQFVNQLGKPEIDSLSGISPTVAIEQRVTRGSRKSTVGSTTEIAQFLRLLYSRIGVQLSTVNQERLTSNTEAEVVEGSRGLFDQQAFPEKTFDPARSPCDESQRASQAHRELGPGERLFVGALRWRNHKDR